MTHTKDMNLLCPSCEYYKAQLRLKEAELKASRWMTKKQGARIRELEAIRETLIQANKSP